MAQTQAGQVIIAEVMLGRMKIMKNLFVRQATVGAVVWMSDQRKDESALKFLHPYIS